MKVRVPIGKIILAAMLFTGTSWIWLPEYSDFWVKCALTECIVLLFAVIIDKEK